MSGIVWERLPQPKAWKPKQEGAELVGFFLGLVECEGRFGPYRAAMLAVPTDSGGCAWVAAGVHLVNTIDSAGVEPGAALRVVWEGWGELTSGYAMKVFGVYVCEGSVTAAQVREYLATVEGR